LDNGWCRAEVGSVGGDGRDQNVQLLQSLIAMSARRKINPPFFRRLLAGFRKQAAREPGASIERHRLDSFTHTTDKRTESSIVTA
jgi:hypothetical protein